MRLCDEVIPQFPNGYIELLIVYPSSDDRFEWHDLPACIKREAEMRLYGATIDVYTMYGIDSRRGATVLVRPDGYVGAVYGMEDIAEVVDYFGNCLVQAV
jgi:hypothetical protein